MPGGASARRPRRRPVASPARRKTTDSASRMSRAFLWGIGFTDVGMDGWCVCGGREREKDEDGPSQRRAKRAEAGRNFAARSRLRPPAVPGPHLFLSGPELWSRSLLIPPFRAGCCARSFRQPIGQAPIGVSRPSPSAKFRSSQAGLTLDLHEHYGYLTIAKGLTSSRLGENEEEERRPLCVTTRRIYALRARDPDSALPSLKHPAGMTS